MTNEAETLAGNRSERDFNDEAPFDLPTKDGVDLAMFPIEKLSTFICKVGFNITD